MNCCLLFFLASSAGLSAAVVAVDSYTHLTTVDSSYPDSGGIEMTDGIKNSAAWGPGIVLTVSDVTNLSGWLNRSPVIEFDFGAHNTIQQVTVWAADSDGAAGVAFPSGLVIRTPDNSFSQSFTVSDPDGFGNTKPIVLDGFSVISDKLIVEATPTSSWTMFSEVEFNSTPEPSSALLSLLALGMTLRRRR